MNQPVKQTKQPYQKQYFSLKRGITVANRLPKDKNEALITKTLSTNENIINKIKQYDGSINTHLSVITLNNDDLYA